MFQMLGVFAEFERAKIRERVNAGLARAKAQGKRLGSPPVAPIIADKVRCARDKGLSVREIAAKYDLGLANVRGSSQPKERHNSGKATTGDIPHTPNAAGTPPDFYSADGAYGRK